MTGRERIIAALQRHKVDRIPFSLCLDNYFVSSLPKQGYNMNLLETFRYLNNDIMERHSPIYRIEYGGKINITTDNLGDVEILSISTPLGKLKQVKQRGSAGFRKYLLETMEDIKAYTYCQEHLEFVPDYETFERHQEKIGDDGIATPDGWQTPILWLLEHEMGIENTVYALKDYPDEMEYLFDVMHEKIKKSYEIIADSPAVVGFTYEDTSTTFLSDEYLEKYCIPCLNEYSDILHRADKVHIVHMCGKLKGFANQIRDCELDGVDSLCPPTTGDMWPHEARESWGSKIIIGGLEPPALVWMNEEETIRYTVDVLNSIAPGENFVLSTGDAVAHDTPLDNLSCIATLVEKYGDYPLDGHLDAAEIVKDLLK